MNTTDERYLYDMFIDDVKGTLGKPSTEAGVIETLTVTENGTYTPPEGVDGYAPVEVDVPPTVVDSPIVLSSASHFFYDEVRLDLLDRINVSNTTNFGYMFYRCYNLTTIPELDTSNGTHFGYMFYLCRNLTTIPELDTSNGTHFGYMFNECYNLTTIPKLDTSKGTNFDYMFCYCGLTTIPELDTSNGTKFRKMFSNMNKLTTIPELDTSNGTDFYEMFYYSGKLTTIPKLDISKGTNFVSMFNGCTALENLTLYNIRKSIQIGSGTSWGHLLTEDSLVHTIKELCTVTSTQTLTMGAANTAKIADLYCKVIDDSDEKKPMELCQSSDEGAMLLTDYALLKNWVIA